MYILVIFFLLLLVLPLSGLWMLGEDIAPWLAFPPIPRQAEHAPFSWIVFLLLTFMVVVLLLPFIGHCHYRRSDFNKREYAGRIPWWGWAGFCLILFGWIVAWQIIPIEPSWRQHTFTPLWLGYILMVNGWSHKRKGFSLLTRHPWDLGGLSILSAIFWWSLEFLNRFTENWHYLQTESYPAWKYLCLASLPFATVLPAVWSTAELLSSFGWGNSFRAWYPVKVVKSGLFRTAIPLVSVLSLITCGLAPDFLFPCLWISPFLLLVVLESSLGKETILSSLEDGDWSRIIQFSLAALVCGLFWEMWNEFSLPQWKYSIPWVGRFRIFEMPILGYSGYLSFGWECAAVGKYLMKLEYLD
jgi:hypothetical protein